MKEKIIPKEIIEEPRDIQYEIFRAIKTIFVVLIIFCFGFILKKQYLLMLENARNIRFYPATTVYYEDFNSASGFNRNISLPKDCRVASYGIFKNNFGKDNFLVVAEALIPDNTKIQYEENHFSYSKDGYLFISDNSDILKDIQIRTAHENFELLKDTNIKKLIQYLNKNRDYTFIVTDVSYSNLPLNENTKIIVNKIFDKAMIQANDTFDGIEFSGKIIFKNKLADFATNLKNIRVLSDKKLILKNFNTKNTAFVVGIKDFDIWSNVFVKIIKTLPDNQYSNTFSLIQNAFNSDIEDDIINKLSGNAVLYMFRDNKALYPMLILDTKQNLDLQAKKYLDFLQITNKSQLTEKEMNNKTFNIISSQAYPYNISFGSENENTFIVGYQNIIEKYLENDNYNHINKDSDIYIGLNFKNIPAFYKNKGFWNNYKTTELDLNLSSFVNFSGKLVK